MGPVVIAAEVILSIQTIDSRKSKPIIPVRDFSVSNFRGDDSSNVIPDAKKKKKKKKKIRDYRYGKNLIQGIEIPDAAFDEETIKGITSFNNATYQFEYLQDTLP